MTNLKILRLADDIDIPALSLATGINPGRLEALEAGTLQPEPEEVRKLCTYFSIEESEFLGTLQERGTAVFYGPTVHGWPLVCIGENARGILAVGAFSSGVISIGCFSRGLVSIGLFSTGILSAGCFSFGLASLGLVSLGLFSAGCLSLGIVSFGIFSAGIWAYGLVSFGLRSLGTIRLGPAWTGLLAERLRR